MSVINLFGSSF